MNVYRFNIKNISLGEKWNVAVLNVISPYFLKKIFYFDINYNSVLRPVTL